jgi:hypothetical protein
MSGKEKFKTKKDAIEEKRTVAILNQQLKPHFNVIHNETPNNHYDFDVYNQDNQLVSIMEFKRRYIDSYKYDTWVIAKVKIERLIAIANELQCKPIWIFGFNNEYRWANVNNLTPDDLGSVVTIRRDKPRKGGQRGVSDIEDGYEVTPNDKWHIIPKP